MANSNDRWFSRTGLIAALLSICGVFYSSHALAQVSVTPTRLVFDRPGKTLPVYLNNTDTVEHVYDLSLVDRVMLPSGEIVAVDQIGPDEGAIQQVAGLLSAKDHVLVTPSRVTLGPGRGQVVRVRYSGAADAPAESRTHLVISALPSAEDGQSVEQALGTGQFSMRLSVSVGISIPLIARNGRPDISASFGDPRISWREAAAEPGVPAQRVAMLEFLLRRGGANGLYGRLEVKGNKGEVLGQMVGVGVYPEIEARRVQLSLVRPPREGEVLTLSFFDGQDQPGRRIASLALPPHE